MAFKGTLNPVFVELVLFADGRDIRQFIYILPAGFCREQENTDEQLASFFDYRLVFDICVIVALSEIHAIAVFSWSKSKAVDDGGEAEILSAYQGKALE